MTKTPGSMGVQGKRAFLRERRDAGVNGWVYDGGGSSQHLPHGRPLSHHHLTDRVFSTALEGSGGHVQKRERPTLTLSSNMD